MKERISKEYLATQIELHNIYPEYGFSSVMYAPQVKALLEDCNISTISDYGAGKCRLRDELTKLGASFSEYYPYDPAYPEYGDARPAELVCCIDVLEHVEPEYLDSVLDDLKRIIVKFGLLTVHTGPAVKVLPDGRNAHLIQEGPQWWMPKLQSGFKVLHYQAIENGFWVLVHAASA